MGSGEAPGPRPRGQARGIPDRSRAQAAVEVVSPASAPAGCQAGGDDGAGREGVAAHDVHGDQLRPPLGLLDAGFAGVAGGGEFAGVGFEVLEADPGAAPDQRRLTHLGGADPQDQRQPPGPGVHAGFPEHPLDTVPGDHAPGPPGNEPARRTARSSTAVTMTARTTAAADERPGQGPVQAEVGPAEDGEDGQFGAQPPQGTGGAGVQLGGEPVQHIGVVAVIARAGLGGHHSLPVSARSCTQAGSGRWR